MLLKRKNETRISKIDTSSHSFKKKTNVFKKAQAYFGFIKYST